MRALRVVAALLFLGLSGLFGATFYRRRVANRDCFNAEGRCFDAETGTVILEQAGVVWMSLTLLCLGIAFLLIWSLKRPQ
ncbi:MAG: hypothetical protein AAF280_10980 [Pseudomonadota bacterium]